MADGFPNIPNFTSVLGQDSVSGSSPVKELAYGLAGHAGTAAINGVASFLLSERQFRNQRRLMKEQYALQREATRNQMSDERESYIKAGLNPNLLAQGGFSPVAVGSSEPAKQNVSGASPQTAALAEQAVLNTTLKEQEAGIENTEAQTQGQRLKNEEQQIVNDRLRDEDVANDLNIRGYMENILENLPEGGLRDQLEGKLNDSDYRFTAGSAKAVSDFVKLLRDSSNMSREQAENLYQREIAKTILNSPEVIESMAKMGDLEYRKGEAYIHEVASVIARNYADVSLTGSQIELNEQTMHKLAADIAKMHQDSEREALQDSRYLVKQGRWKDFATNVAFNGIEYSAEVLKSFASGASFGAGAALTKRVAEGSNVAPTTRKSLSNLPNVEYEPTSYKHPYLTPKELSNIPLDQRKRMATIEYRQFVGTHPRYGQKRLETVRKRIGEKYGVFTNPQNKLRRGK